MQGLLGCTLSQSVPWSLQSHLSHRFPPWACPALQSGCHGVGEGVLEEGEPKEMPTPVLSPTPSAPSTRVCDV